MNEAACAGYSLATLKLIELDNGCQEDRMAALQDVIELYQNGNSDLRIEPDIALQRIYLEQYYELNLKLTQTYLPNKPHPIEI